MVEKFSKCYYNKYKIIPNEILNGEYQTKLDFIKGYYQADGSKLRKDFKFRPKYLIKDGVNEIKKLISLNEINMLNKSIKNLN